MGFENSWYTDPCGLVLAGGGGKGAYQIGVFKALYESGLADSITHIAGSSVGALNMCLFKDNNEKLGEEIWKHISPEEFIDIEENMIDGKEGLVSRDGLLNIIDGYIDLNALSDSSVTRIASVTEYADAQSSQGIVRYCSINNKTPEEIKSILLASSALPFIYEPVVMEGKLYRDGGLSDNLPIKPLYDLGIRHFVVALLSTTTNVPVYMYPGAKFLIIRPTKSLGDTLTGTLDFTAQGASKRIELGYMDAARYIRFYGDTTVNISEIAAIDNRQLDNSQIVSNAQNRIDNSMSKLNDLLKKYE